MIWFDVRELDDWWLPFSVAMARSIKDKVNFLGLPRQNPFFSRFHYKFSTELPPSHSSIRFSDFYGKPLEDLPYSLNFPRADFQREGRLICHPSLYNDFWGRSYSFDNYKLILKLLRVESSIIGPFCGVDWPCSFEEALNLVNIWDILANSVLYIGSPNPIAMMSRLVGIPTIVIYDHKSWLKELSYWWPGDKEGHVSLALNCSPTDVVEYCNKFLGKNAWRVHVPLIL